MTTSPGLRRPPGRYDEPRALPPWARVGGAVLLLAALVALSFVGYRHYATGRAQFANLGAQVVSDTSVTVRFSVVVEGQRSVQCVLQARDRDNREVGSRVVTVRSEQTRTVTREETLTTTRRAVAAEVLSCRPRD